jgi:hypothetical protein
MVCRDQIKDQTEELLLANGVCGPHERAAHRAELVHAGLDDAGSACEVARPIGHPVATGRYLKSTKTTLNLQQTLFTYSQAFFLERFPSERPSSWRSRDFGFSS